MKTKATFSRRILPALLLALASLPAAAQDRDFSQIEIKTQQLAPGLYMLQGAGGNLGLSTGEDGSLLVDDDYAPLTEKIKAAIAKLNAKPPRFVINTHWHDDHSGGNANLGKDGTVVVAHDNVRARMSAEQTIKLFDMTVPPSPHAALPVLTYADGVTFQVNGEEVKVFHLANAHTDGDSAVHFRKANVIHTGDLFFNGMYPFIDVDTGGSIDGMIAAGKQILAACDEKTQIIPGHGPVANKATYAKYIAMLEEIRARVAAMIAEGKTRDQVIAAKPGGAYDQALGGGFIKPDTMAGMVYSSLKK